jgi:hypothetical protein
VLEHPIYSRLWDVMELPPPGERDAWGGWTLPVHQFWWGHDCEKRTWLYIVGCEPEAIPDIPLVLGRAPMVVENRTTVTVKRKVMRKSQRNVTPPAFAAWLVELAGRCKRIQKPMI